MLGQVRLGLVWVLEINVHIYLSRDTRRLDDLRRVAWRQFFGVVYRSRGFPWLDLEF